MIGNTCTTIYYHPIPFPPTYILSLTLFTSIIGNEVTTLALPPLLLLLHLLHLQLILKQIPLLPVMVTVLHLLHILILDIIIPEERVISLCFILLFLRL